MELLSRDLINSRGKARWTDGQTDTHTQMQIERYCYDIHNYSYITLHIQSSVITNMHAIY